MFSNDIFFLVRICACVHTCMHVEARIWCQVFSSITFHLIFEIRDKVTVPWGSLIQLDWLTSKPLWSSCLGFLGAGMSGTSLCVELFNVGIGILNSSLHATTTDRSPQSLTMLATILMVHLTYTHFIRRMFTLITILVVSIRKPTWIMGWCSEKESQSRSKQGAETLIKVKHFT